jgi:hypothetical protein
MFSSVYIKLHNAQIRAALGLSQVDEALYLQRQQELQRDFQIRQMLLQEQVDQQNRLDTMLHEQQLKAIGEHLQEFPDLQQHYHSLLLNEQLQRHEERTLLRERAQGQQQEELRRRQMGQVLAQKQSQQAAGQTQTATTDVAATSSVARLRDLAADSLAGNAVKRTELDKRKFAGLGIAGLEEEDAASTRRERTNTIDSTEDRKPKAAPKKPQPKKFSPIKTHSSDESIPMQVDLESPLKPSALALLDFATSKPEKVLTPVSSPAPPEPITPAGTIQDLLAAADGEEKSEKAISTLYGIKRHVEWSDSEEELEEENEDVLARDYRIAVEKGETIDLPNFMSILPQLPEEPEIREVISKKKKKHKSILDEESAVTKASGKSKSDKNDSHQNAIKAPELAVIEYPYPIDTWWPSVTSVRRERKATGEPLDEDAFAEDPEYNDPKSPFRANMQKIRDRFANEVEPGVLEKIPQCKIHRMLMKKRKNPSAPELVYCWQVTELYPNDIMVCCSQCGTWRHAACGGHYKPYSVRECIHTPLTTVCDRCHEEERTLHDYPLAHKRIDRQRTEQIRRGLATSAAMRQASFSKHGGTYKWPLGSVSATHIGGHTRSVHSRHDKAEKQWADMATRLGRGYGYRPKERVKVRTKELERLLVSVEDAGK